LCPVPGGTSQKNIHLTGFARVIISKYIVIIRICCPSRTISYPVLSPERSCWGTAHVMSAWEGPKHIPLLRTQNRITTSAKSEYCFPIDRGYPQLHAGLQKSHSMEASAQEDRTDLHASLQVPYTHPCKRPACILPASAYSALLQGGLFSHLLGLFRTRTSGF
jgi:hypothetical protein